MEHQEPAGPSPVIVAECVQVSVSNGVVIVAFNDGAEIGIEIKRELHEVYLRITGGRKMPFLFTSGDTLWISKDAHEFERKIEQAQPQSAVAFVATSLVARLLADFYLKFYKPGIPYRVFTVKDDAEEWLRSFWAG